MEIDKEYKKYRHFYTSAGNLVICGKNAEQNEEVVKLAEKDESVLHTKAPGSPFCLIKGLANAKDKKETAIFCAYYSRDWKMNKKDVEIHVFRGRDLFKESGMALGTFGVKRAKKIIAKKSDIESIKK